MKIGQIFRSYQRALYTWKGTFGSNIPEPKTLFKGSRAETLRQSALKDRKVNTSRRGTRGEQMVVGGTSSYRRAS